MDNDTNTEEALNQVNGLLAEQKFAEAVELLKNALKAAPDNIELTRLLGLNYINLEDYNNAIETLEKAVKLNTEDAVSWFYLATMYDAKNMLAEAEDAYLEVIKLRENYVDAHKNISVVYIKNSLLDKAKYHAQKALELSEESDNEDYQIYYILSTIAMQESNYPEVVEYLMKGTEIAPNHIQMINNIGSAYLAMSNIEKALEYYQKASAIDPENPLTNYNLGSLYQITGNHEKAFEYFEMTYKKESTTNNLAILGIAAMSAHKWKEAVDIYTALVNLQPDKQNFQHNLAAAYVEVGELAKAIHILNALYMLNPTNIVIIEKLTDLYLLTNQTEKVKEFLSGVIKRGKVSTEIYYSYAIICAKTRDIDVAVSIFKKVIQLDPKNPNPHKDLGVIYLGQKLFDYAKEEFHAAYELASDDPNMVFELATFYYQIHDYREAEKYYQKALAMQPDNIYSRVYAGLNYLNLNQLDKAKELLEDVYPLVSADPVVSFNLARIYYIEKNYQAAKQILYGLDAFNDNYEMANLLGLILMETGDYAQAADVFKNLLEQNEGNTNLLMNLARAKIALEDRDSALIYLNKLVEIFPDSEEAHELIREIS